MADSVRLRCTLGTPQLAWIVTRLRQQLERGESLEGTISLAAPTNEQRVAVAKLFGCKPTRGERLTVPLVDLEKLLREAELCDSLADAVATLGGPVTNTRQAEAARRSQWHALFAEAAATIDAAPFVSHTGGPGAGRQAQDRAQLWLSELRDTGLLRRIARDDLDAARRLLNYALLVLARLPAPDLSLAEMAARVLGDSHALDSGASLSTLVLRAISCLHETPFPKDAESRRESWASVGVWCDALSAPVLAFNLRADGSSTTALALRLHADAGEPYRLSLRQLLRDVPRFSVDTAGETVFVCENPTIVAAAADRLGCRSRPLVCLDGEPKTAGNVLLKQLVGGSVRLLYHGDFDWPGIGIANRVIARRGVAPWRMDAPAYHEAAIAGQLPLTGEPVVASWDESLTQVMMRIGIAVHEEQVLESLLADLSG